MYNRTIQELMYKNTKDKLLSCKNKKAVEVYNEAYHTGVEMSPNEAIKKENQEIVKKVQYQNIRKFQERNKHLGKEDVFKINDVVLIRDELYKSKDKPKFRERGIISQICGNNSYKIKMGKKEIKRHASQLKLLVVECFTKEEGC